MLPQAKFLSVYFVWIIKAQKGGRGVPVVLTPISQIWKLRLTEPRTLPALWDSHRLQDTHV